MAFRVWNARAQQRREQANQDTKVRRKGSRRDVQVGKRHQATSQQGRHRHRVGKQRLELAEWTILLSNVPNKPEP